MSCRQDKVVAAPAAAKADLKTQTIQAANPTRERLAEQPATWCSLGTPKCLQDVQRHQQNVSAGIVWRERKKDHRAALNLPGMEKWGVKGRGGGEGKTLNPVRHGPSRPPVLPFFLYIWTIAKGCQKMGEGYQMKTY